MVLNNDIIQGFLNIIQNDTSDYPQAIVGYEGNDSVKAVRMSPYGLCSMPPQGSLGLIFTPNSMNGVRYGLFDDPTNRFKGLSSGEVQIGNYSTQASIKFDKDGNVTINVPSGNLTANVSGITNIDTTQLNINASGGSFITGSLNITGDITANNFVSATGVDFNGHIHTGDSGSDTSVPK